MSDFWQNQQYFLMPELTSALVTPSINSGLTLPIFLMFLVYTL